MPANRWSCVLLWTVAYGGGGTLVRPAFLGRPPAERHGAPRSRSIGFATVMPRSAVSGLWRHLANVRERDAGCQDGGQALFSFLDVLIRYTILGREDARCGSAKAVPVRSGARRKPPQRVRPLARVLTYLGRNSRRGRPCISVRRLLIQFLGFTCAGVVNRFSVWTVSNRVEFVFARVACLTRRQPLRRVFSLCDHLEANRSVDGCLRDRLSTQSDTTARSSVPVRFVQRC